MGENVIIQGQFYLDRLADRQAELKLLMQEKLGIAAADVIDWSAPRRVCIAAYFAKFGGYAVQPINRNIELIRCRCRCRCRSCDGELLLFDLGYASSAQASKSCAGGNKVAQRAKDAKEAAAEKAIGSDKPYAEIVMDLSLTLTDLPALLQDYISSTGDDLRCKQLRLQVALKRFKNFASLLQQQRRPLPCLHFPPAPVTMALTIARDVSDIGQWGTRDAEISLSTLAEQEAVRPFIAAS